MSKSSQVTAANSASKSVKARSPKNHEAGVINGEAVTKVIADPGIDAGLLDKIIAEISTVFLGRRAAIETALICVLADGHLLIEDVPGSGKTSLSAALARVLGLDFKRVQCTNDLLPADITGLSIFDRETGKFILREGPVFTQLLLADELNRAPSKTQSALLQAMEERTVTIDKDTMALPQPFLVIATQNPTEQIGTFDLPESQLDRFSVSMEIGRPDHDTQMNILLGQMGVGAEAVQVAGAGSRQSADLRPMIDTDQLLALQAATSRLAANDAVLGYILRLADMMEATTPISLSVRFRSQLLRLAQAHAMLNGRDFVAPDDVQAMFGPAVGHRMTRVEPAARAELVAATISKTDLP